MTDTVIRTNEDIIRELTRYVDDLRSERDQVIKEAEDEVQTLRTYAQERDDRATGLEDRVDTLMEENDALRHREGCIAELTDALSIYLSWMNSPPPGIDPARHAEIARKFRMDVDYALRGVR